jgi:hypothetical protein
MQAFGETVSDISRYRSARNAQSDLSIHFQGTVFHGTHSGVSIEELRSPGIEQTQFIAGAVIR